MHNVNRTSLLLTCRITFFLAKESKSWLAISASNIPLSLTFALSTIASKALARLVYENCLQISFDSVKSYKIDLFGEGGGLLAFFAELLGSPRECLGVLRGRLGEALGNFGGVLEGFRKLPEAPETPLGASGASQGGSWLLLE